MCNKTTFIKSSQQLKDKIKNLSLKDPQKSQIYLRIFFMERLLERISVSKYKNNIIIKGGVLMICLNNIFERTTKDIDSTLEGIIFDLENLTSIFTEIINLEIYDNVKISISKFKPNMLNKFESGYELTLNFSFEDTREVITFDLSQGDLIIPNKIERTYTTFLEKRKINIMSFPLESVIAEKLHAILERGIFTTRWKDFYDLYLISNRDDFSLKITLEAILKIFNKHSHEELLKNKNNILKEMFLDSNIKKQWNKYKNENDFVTQDLEWEKVFNSLIIFLEKIFNEQIILEKR